jgi:hypothetical protein
MLHKSFSGSFYLIFRAITYVFSVSPLRPPNLTAGPFIGTASDPVRVLEVLYECCGTVVLFSSVFPLHHCERIPRCNLRRCTVLFRCGWTARDGHGHVFWRMSQDISGKGTVALSGPAVFLCQATPSDRTRWKFHVPG